MLGNKIKELRNIKGIYQQELADALSVSKSTIAMWETNKREPDLNMIKKISAFFNVSIDYLLDCEEKKQKEIKESYIINRIERARNNMSFQEQERMMNIIEAAFPEYFNGDFVDEDLDE